MQNNETVSVQMTPEMKASFEAFRKEQEQKERRERAKMLRDNYSAMVDEEIEKAIPVLSDLSANIAEAKKKVMDDFKAIIELKGEIFRLRKDEQLSVKSHQFTNSNATARITIGAYQVDNYKDTAEDGINIVKEYISDLAVDAKSRSLVNMVLKLLSKDAKGTLKASRIIQLRKLADETGDERFIEGVKIIEEAYMPVSSKTFVRAEVKGENGEWKNLPLGMTES